MSEPATPDEIRRLEAIARDAWPPEQVALHDGWRLHLSDGGTRRARCVYPEADGVGPLSDRIGHCQRFYAARGLRCVFKLTSASLPGNLDEGLARRAWVRRGETCVQTVSLAVERRAAVDPRASVAEAFDDEWLERCIALRGDAGRDARAHAEMIARVSVLREPVGFARIQQAGGTIAIGLGIVADGHVFVVDVATDPMHRGRGLARAVVDGLLTWGADHGAETGLLQVVADNAPALRLYAGLGFLTRYRYWYREAPEVERS